MRESHILILFQYFFSAALSVMRRRFFSDKSEAQKNTLLRNLDRAYFVLRDVRMVISTNSYIKLMKN